MIGYGGERGKPKEGQSSEEELGLGDDGSAADATKRATQSQSLWQRIKWTDNMVRLLIWIVHSVGEDVTVGDCAEQQHKGKKAPVEMPAGMQQKKGKWKSVSREMMKKGFYVSPQQCEDKFNDLNKRYKRLNELVGKGTACVVVDSPALLDSLANHLPHKSIEEARKLLSSKHLFFREMCAYHNTYPVSAADSSAAAQKYHSPSAGEGHDHNYFNDVEDEEGEYEYNGESDEEDEHGKGTLAATGGGGGRMAKRKAAMCQASSPPLALTLSSPSGCSSTPMHQLKSEMVGFPEEQQRRQWLRMRAAELEEQRVAYQGRALQLERQRLKWLRFSSNKEREMERTMLRNERRRLENDQMLLLLQQKEFALFHPPSNEDVK